VSQRSKIEWTDSTWNPVRGCTKISPGCAHCYAETFAERFRGVPGHPYEFGFDLRLVPEKLNEPLSWKKPRRVFVNSMSDLFHDKVPDDYVRQVFSVMERAHWHQFQVLTKRPERVVELNGVLPWPEHIWLGVSVESSRYRHRIDSLCQTSARTKFLSLEPLLGDLPRLNLAKIDWVIVGGESGPGARPMNPDWIRQIQRQCQVKHVAFFFKQWGTFGPDGVRRSKSDNGRLLDGKTWDEWPHDLISENGSGKAKVRMEQ
jgi:protein gp37